MTDTTDNVELATALTIAWLGNPNTRTNAEDVPSVLTTMHNAIAALTSPSEPEAAPAPEYTPAVSARKSLASPDHIISMIDGKPYKALTRHLTTNGLTPAEYRTRYGLKEEYPMVAPTYSEARRAMAKKIGLGRKPGTKVKKAAPAAAAPAKPEGVRAAKAAAKAHLGNSDE